MTIAATMNAEGPQAHPARRPHARPAQGLGRLLRAPQRRLPQANPQGKDLVRWKYQRYMHDYLGCVKAVDEGVGRVLKFLDDEGLADEHDRRLLGRPGVLPRRARLVRQALDLRGVAPHPAARPLAGRGEAGQGRRATRLEPRLRRDLPRRRRPARPRRHAGPQPRPAPEGPDPGRLAEGVLLRVYEYRPPPRPPPLRRRDRPLQARPLLRPRRRRLGAVRPPDRSARASKRLRGAVLCRGGRGTEEGNRSPSNGAESPVATTRGRLWRERARPRDRVSSPLADHRMVPHSMRPDFGGCGDVERLRCEGE